MTCLVKVLASLSLALFTVATFVGFTERADTIRFLVKSQYL